MLRTSCNGVLFSPWYWREQIIYLDGNQASKAWSRNGNGNEEIKNSKWMVVREIYIFL